MNERIKSRNERVLFVLSLDVRLKGDEFLCNHFHVEDAPRDEFVDGLEIRDELGNRIPLFELINTCLDGLCVAGKDEELLFEQCNFFFIGHCCSQAPLHVV